MEKRNVATPTAEDEWSYQGRTREQVSANNAVSTIVILVATAVFAAIGLVKLGAWVSDLLK